MDKQSSEDSYPLELPENRAEFFAALTEVFPAQSNDPACDRSANAACDIGGACAIMTNFSSESLLQDITSPSGRNARAKDQSLLTLAATARAAFGDDRCVDCDHSKNVRFLNVTALPADTRRDYDGDRAWFWQTCVEFGFYQTCSDARCPFYSAEVPENGSPDDATPLSLAFFTKPCASVFGLDLEFEVFPAANRSNFKTGGITPGGSRIMYPSGSVDPWRANSFTPELAGSVPHRTERAVKKTLPALMVLGASHHAWTHPPLETDQESVVKARAAIASQVEKWLEETDVTSEEGRVVFEA
jgi:serine protease 16